MSRYTTPSLKPRNVMSPPSLATAGRTRASINSLMVATVSESFASKNSSPSPDGAASALFTIGAPDMKCSIMTPRIAGLSCCHSPAVLVTAMKSEPKNTPEIPAISNRRSASGDCAAASLSRMSSVPLVKTGRPGRNLSVAGFGVGSVWMNMACSFNCAGSKSLRLRHCNRWRRAVEVSTCRSARPKGDGPRGAQPWLSLCAQLTAGQARRGSRHGIEFLIAKVAGHDRDRDGKVARGLADTGDERPRSLFAGRGREYQDGDVFVVLDEIEDFLRLLAFADHALRHHASDARGARRMTIEHGIRFLVRLRPHDVGDAEPLLIAVVGFDHTQHEHCCADAQRAPAGEIERAIAFRRIVDDDHEFRRVTSFVAAPLLAHRLPQPPPGLHYCRDFSRRTGFAGRRCQLPVALQRLRILPRPSGAAQGHARRGSCKQSDRASCQRRTNPTMSLTAFMVSAAMTCARAAPSASTESI